MCVVLTNWTIHLALKKISAQFVKNKSLTIAGVPGEKPKETSDKLPDSPSKFPCIQL